MSVFMLTRNGCTQCQQLKMVLKFALNDKYKDDIQIVNKEDDVELFDKLTSQHNVLSLPVLISGDDVLINTQPTPLVAFLEQHVGKK